ncbi:MAG: EamA family transporter [Clostridia bacterium]|nr:EamA family transporter [Clostridia bacterium]
MNGLLLAVSVVMNLLSCGILRNDFCKKEITGNADLNAFNSVSSLLSAGTLAVIALVSGSLCVPSAYTVVLGIIFGIATALCAILHMKALENGPLSYTSVICSCAMVIPALSGLLFFGEAVTALQYVGIVLMVISFVCAVDKQNGEAGMSFKWMLLCLGSFMFSGSVGVMQKVHQSSPHKDELGIFLVIAFVASALFSAVLSAYYKNGGQQITVLSGAKLKKFVLVSVVCGIGIALCNQINMFLAGVMEAIIFYPVVNGAGMLLTTAAGIIFWKEKLSKKQWFGLVTGAAAIFLLCGVF